MPIKWKIYRIINYLLLVSGALLFLRFFQLSIGYSYQLFAFLTSLIFLFMLLQSLMNLVIMSKTFPDKMLTAAKNRWHILATILNVFSIAGMTYGFFSLLAEIAEFPDEKALLILLIIMITFILFLFFVFICQLTLKRYLHRTNITVMKAMIDSIGSDEESK